MKVFLTPVLGALLLTSCAKFDERVNASVSMIDVVDRIQCELKEAYINLRPQYPWLKNWATSFELSLQKDVTLGVTPKLEYATPIPSGMFNLEASAGISGRSSQTLVSKRTISLLPKLLNFACPALLRDTTFGGRLGIEEALRDILSVRDKGDVFDEYPTAPGYKIEFDLKYNASASPMFAFTRITGIGAGFSYEQQKRSSVDFAFTDATPAGPAKPQRVFVVNFPPGYGATRSPAAVSPSPAAGGGRRLKRRDEAGADQRNSPLSPEVRQRLDATINRLQMQNLRFVR